MKILVALVSLAWAGMLNAGDMGTSVQEVSFADIDSQLLGACDELELSDEQKERIHHILHRAKRRGQELHERAVELHHVYAENVRRPHGSKQEAMEIGQLFADLSLHATGLKMRVINTILFDVMNSVDQRILASRCMHEKHEGDN